MEVRSLTKALRLLDALGEQPGALGVSELARQLELDKSSVSRMLRTMEQAGFVEQDPITQRYALGMRIGILGHKALRRLDLRGAARPQLEALAEVTGECSHIAILADNRAFYIDQASPRRGVVVGSPIGTLAPCHCTALGKALIASKPDSLLDELLGKVELEPFTRRTITNVDTLRRHLEGVRESGVAIDDEEFSVGVRCIAAPVLRYDGEVCGAIGVSGPSPRVTDDRLRAWEPVVRNAARELSLRLGWEEDKAGKRPVGAMEATRS